MKSHFFLFIANLFCYNAFKKFCKIHGKKDRIMNLTTMHAVIILFTVALVIGIGIYHSRSIKSAAGYSVGGRSAGVPLVAGSIAGTVVGGGATIGTAQLAFNFGLSAWWFTLGSGIAFILMGLFYARRMRGTGLETIPQFLSLNYGKRRRSFLP